MFIAILFTRAKVKATQSDYQQREGEAKCGINPTEYHFVFNGDRASAWKGEKVGSWTVVMVGLAV